MKILLINHFPLTGSGSGIYTKNLAEGLIARNNNVHIIAPENTLNFEDIEGAKIDYIFFKNDEEIINQIPFNFPCFTTHPRSLKTFYELTEEELNMYVDSFSKLIDKVIKEFKPDIIHSQHIWILSAIAAKYDIPLIVTAHGTDIIGYDESSRFDKFGDEVIKKSSRIITIAKDNMSSVLKRFKEAKGKIEYISNGYDENVFYKCNYNRTEVLKKFGIEENFENIVTYVGKLTKCKGVDVLLKAAQNYENSKTLTIIVGDGRLKKKLKELSKELNLNNVVFLGNRSQNELREIYNISDVVVVPSRREAFGLVAIEAIACGTPVICSNIGGMSEFVTEKVGYVVEIEDYHKIVENVLNIIENKSLFDNNYIAEYAKEYFSKDIFVEKTQQLYMKCIEEERKK